MSRTLAALGQERALKRRWVHAAWNTVKALTGFLGMALGTGSVILGLGSGVHGYLSSCALLLILGVGLLIAGYDFGFRSRKC